MPAPAHHDARTRDEGLQVQGVVVEDASALGVGRVVELEATIEAVTIDEVGANPSTHVISGLEHRDLDTVPGEVTSGGQATQPCSDDDDGHGAKASRVTGPNPTARLLSRLAPSSSPGPTRLPGSSAGWRRHRHRATITGIRAAWITAVLTDPSSMPAKPPRPRLPTTRSWADSACSSN